MEIDKEQVSELKKLVGIRLREYRKRAGFKSVEQAAEAMGVHATSVYEVERGENWLSPEMGLRMMAIYHLPNLSFVFGDPATNLRPTPQEAIAVLGELVKQSVAAAPINDPLAGLDGEHRADALAFIDGLRHQQGLRSSKRDKRGS